MTIEELVCRNFSLQQTALVDNMLYEDRHMDMYNFIHNQHLYTAELSSGTFKGIHNQLMTKKAEIQQQLQVKRTTALKQDVELLEAAYGKVRVVYEWYAIPYWIARHMIDSNEVVLSWRDCYWWCRCVVHMPVLSDTCILELYQSCYLPE